MTERVISSAAPAAVIKVIGVGGGGGNAINSMIASGITGVEFIAANTDVQALKANHAPIKIQLGRELTKGLGAGANPDVGRDAALEDKAILQEVLAGADMVFVTAGMGGGTGTGAAPIIAHVAREIGALTLAVVTKPFSFEGKKRKNQCEIGISNLKEAVDTLITIPNQRLLSIAPPQMTMLDSFKLADEVLVNAVKGISDIINISGYLNVDFADVRRIMSNMGMALMGIGTSSGPNRATEAARLAISSPLLEDVDIEGATGLLINITSSKDITLQEVSEACSLIQESAHEDAEVIFGHAFDDSLQDTLRITVIATGFDHSSLGASLPTQFGMGFARESLHNQANQNPAHFQQPAAAYPRTGQANYPVSGNNGSFGANTNSSGNNFGPQTGNFGNMGQANNPNTNPMRPSTPIPSTPNTNVPQSNVNNTYNQGNGGTPMNAPFGVSRGTAQAGNNQQNMGSYPRFPSAQDQGPEQINQAQPTARAANTLSTLSQQTTRQFSTQENVRELPANKIKTEAEQLTHWTLRQTTRSDLDNESLERFEGSNEMNLSPKDSEAPSTDVDEALSLAEELSKVEIDETDFETPAFLRRREEGTRNY